MMSNTINMTVAILAGVVYAESPRSITLPPNYSLFQRLEKAEKASPPSTINRVRAVSCRPPVLLGRTIASISPVAGQPGPLSFSLDQNGYYVKDLLEFLQLTASGKIALADFLPKFQSGAIKIEQMTSMGESRCGRNPAACYVPDKRTIFIDKSIELGGLGPVLMHEIVHSIDPDLHKMEDRLNELHRALGTEMTSVINRTAARVQKEALALMESDFETADVERLRKIKEESALVEQVQQFRSERLAYDWGEQAAKELVALFPAYYQKNPIETQRRTDTEILDGYQMDRVITGKYLSGACDESR